MSDHDPFDGIYDAPAAQDDSKSEVTVVAPDDVDVSVVNEGDAEKPRHLSKTEITRMDKSELQDAARERGLSTSGSRTDLQERLRDYQGE